MNSLLKKAIAECLGTFVLVFVACGAAVFTDTVVGAALAFGLVIVAMAFTIGNISGCHINPAVSLAMAIRKEITWKEFAVYVCAQVVGAVLGSLMLALVTRQFANLGGNVIQPVLYSEAGKLDFMSYFGAFVAEVVLTFIFVFVIIGATDKKFGNGKIAGFIIGLTLVLVHLIGINLTGTSVNPARSLAPAIFQAFGDNTQSLKQVWIWLLAPLAGGALAAFVYPIVFGKKDAKAETKEETNENKED